MACAWELDLSFRIDREFLQLEATCFNDILFLLRAADVDWRGITTRMRKMFTALQLFRRKRGTVKADETLDDFVAGLVAAGWSALVGTVAPRITG